MIESNSEVQSMRMRRCVRVWHLAQSRIFASAICLLFSNVLAASPDDAKPLNSQRIPSAQVHIESRKTKAPESPSEARPANIRVNSTLVLINVTVMDPLNRFVTGLEKDHFHLFEDKIEQPISQFSTEDTPISIGLVFDKRQHGRKNEKVPPGGCRVFQTF